MNEQDILIPPAVMALMRGDATVRCIAERFGVTEVEVQEWRDIFITAGTLALTDYRKGRMRCFRQSRTPEARPEYGGISTTHGHHPPHKTHG